MAKTVKINKKTTLMTDVEVAPLPNKTLLTKIKLNKSIMIIFLLTAIVILAFYKKNWFVAASVNGEPITNIALLAKLNQLYRTPVLSQMIDEKVILDEAQKRGIIITSSEIQARATKWEARFGGKEAFNNLLAQQGQSRGDFESQIKYQLIVEKMFDKEASVSAEEIDQFLKTNKTELQSSDSAQQVADATDLLKQQKIGKIFAQKFPELKQQANIKIF